MNSSTIVSRIHPINSNGLRRLYQFQKAVQKPLQNGYMENYKNVSQDIRDQLNAEAKTVQKILTGIDNDIYSIVDACLNACEMWKAIERLKQGEGQLLLQPTYDQEPEMVAEDDALSKDKEIDKLMALIYLSFKKIYKPTNNNLRTSSNTSRAVGIKRLLDDLKVTAAQVCVTAI
ncbi:hypothetical protein Tco_0237939 [Tanacetum coccineum]